jgi:hypothetical protein
MDVFMSQFQLPPEDLDDDGLLSPRMTRTAHTPNGMPEPGGYVWRGLNQAGREENTEPREAEVAAMVAAARALAAQRIRDVDAHLSGGTS